MSRASSPSTPSSVVETRDSSAPIKPQPIARACKQPRAHQPERSSLAKELAPANIRVNAICPGILRTQMWEYLAETLKGPDESKDDAWQRYVKGLIPLGRAQTPDDIGQLAVYLASAENVTGQAINVDGGVDLH